MLRRMRWPQATATCTVGQAASCCCCACPIPNLHHSQTLDGADGEMQMSSDTTALATLNLRSNEVTPLMFSSVDSVPAFATVLPMPRFSDVVLIIGDSSSQSFPNEPTPRSVSLSIARVARVRNCNQQCSYQVLPAAGNAAGGSKPALSTSSQLSEPLRAGAPHPQPQCC